MESKKYAELIRVYPGVLYSQSFFTALNMVNSLLTFNPGTLQPKREYREGNLSDTRAEVTIDKQ